MTIKEAVKILQRGGIVAYPTETFYGLGVKATDSRAIEKIYKVKKREKGKPISILVSSTKELDQWVMGVGKREKILMEKFWPGSLTLVFKAKKKVPTSLTGNTGKIGIRISPEPVVQKLLQNLSFAITATSANRSGKPPCCTAQSVKRTIGSCIDGVLSKKKLKKSKGSTVLDVSGKTLTIIREGIVSKEEIQSSIESYDKM